MKVWLARGGIVYSPGVHVLISQYKVSCIRLSVDVERWFDVTSLTIRTFLTQKQQRVYPVISKYLYTANTANNLTI